MGLKRQKKIYRLGSALGVLSFRVCPNNFFKKIVVSGWTRKGDEGLYYLIYEKYLHEFELHKCYLLNTKTSNIIAVYEIQHPRNFPSLFIKVSGRREKQMEK